VTTSVPFPIQPTKHGQSNRSESSILFDCCPLLICSKTASTSSSTVQNQSAMTWYACGQALSPGFFDDTFQSIVLDHIKGSMPNLVPTTYKAAKAYLHEESKKPKEQQYLRREMCMMIPLSLPKDRKVYYVVSSFKSCIEIVQGEYY
jgi:hypothetical protein